MNFLDENETNLRDRATRRIGKLNPLAGGLRAESGPESDPLFWLLLAIGGIAMLANWCWAVNDCDACAREDRSMSDLSLLFPELLLLLVPLLFLYFWRGAHPGLAASFGSCCC